MVNRFSCKGCPKRVLGCHSSCPDYKFIKAELEREKESRKHEKAFIAYMSDSMKDKLAYRAKLKQKMKRYVK